MQSMFNAMKRKHEFQSHIWLVLIYAFSINVTLSTSNTTDDHFFVGDVSEPKALGRALKSVAWGNDVILIAEFNPEKASFQCISALNKLKIKHVLLLTFGPVK